MQPRLGKWFEGGREARQVGASKPKPQGFCYNEKRSTGEPFITIHGKMTITANANQIYSRLRAAGIDKPYLKRFVLPDWWDDSVAETKMGFQELALPDCPRVQY